MMEFAELNAAVVKLRYSLNRFVGENALSEITIQHPAGDRDEASFMRLVNWSYVLLFEAGRVSIPYLIKLPSEIPDPKSDLPAARQVVHSLRTWSSHNLNLSGERDRAILRQVKLWFVEQCGVFPPSGESAWRLSFEKLCTEVGALVEHCQGALELVLHTPDDTEDVVADLQRRIDKSWPPHKFDELVSDACARFGLSLDVPRFRNPRLSKWREFLETVPEDDNPERRVIAMIERDILDYTNDILPITGDDVMDALGLEPGPEVGNALRRARELFRSGIRDPEQLLERLRDADSPTHEIR